MTHLSLINVLASDIARLSKILTILVMEIESVHMQELVTETSEKPKNTKQNQSTEIKQAKNHLKTGEKDSSATLTEDTKVVTIEHVYATMVEKRQVGLTSKIKELLERYGVNKLFEVNSDDYVTLMEEVA